MTVSHAQVWLGAVSLRAYKSCGWTFLAAKDNKSAAFHLQLKKLPSGKHAHVSLGIAGCMRQRNIQSHDDGRYNCQRGFGGGEDPKQICIHGSMAKVELYLHAIQSAKEEM